MSDDGYFTADDVLSTFPRRIARKFDPQKYGSVSERCALSLNEELPGLFSDEWLDATYG